MVTSARPGCVIVGGGGHARVLIDTLQGLGEVDVRGILDADADQWGRELFGIPVWGGDDQLPDLKRRGITHFVVGVGSVGDSSIRRRVYELACAADLLAFTVVHPTAICSRRADIGPGCQLLPGSIVNAGAKLGSNVIVNSGAIVEHDCVVGDHAHIATGACLASTVTVGAGAHVGVGASVRQSIVIGEGAVVGGGAVVVRDVAAHTVVAGVPARVLRPVATAARS